MRAKPNPVVCGRRVCNGPCGRWRPITDFKHRAERSARRGFPKGRLQPLAKKLGVDEAFLRRIIKGETTDKSGKTVPYANVTIGLVDRALHASGRETQLIDLYPHLYT
jgi:hypothetical protein